MPLSTNPVLRLSDSYATPAGLWRDRQLLEGRDKDVFLPEHPRLTCILTTLLVLAQLFLLPATTAKSVERVHRLLWSEIGPQASRERRTHLLSGHSPGSCSSLGCLYFLHSIHHPREMNSIRTSIFAKSFHRSSRTYIINVQWNLALTPIPTSIEMTDTWPIPLDFA